MTAEQNGQRQNYYTIDLRVFILLIMTTMSLSFIAGVLMIPPDATVVRSTTVEQALGGVDPGLHRPSGQHLLVDIRNVDGDFLNSEKRLSEAMVETVLEAGCVSCGEGNDFV